MKKGGLKKALSASAVGQSDFRRNLPAKLARFENSPTFNDGADDKDAEGLSGPLAYDPGAITQFIRDNWIKNQMHLEENCFSTYRPSTIFVSTFNVNGKKPGDGSLREWLGHKGRFPENGKMPALYVIGFQEVVDLSAANVLATDAESASRTELWSTLLGEALNDLASPLNGVTYKLVLSKFLVGVSLCVFVSSKHHRYVANVQSENATSGLMGVLGNKGGSSIRMRFYDTTLCFVCSHLAAHQGNVSGRNANFATILEKTRFTDAASTDESAASMYMSRQLGESHEDGTFGILEHDVVIWLGDLNYRLVKGVALEEAFVLVDEGRRGLDYLLRLDQLNRERRAGRVFQDFDEGAIDFPPSYKFIPGTDRFDDRKEKKMRMPAWCDRILWRVSGGNDSTTPDTEKPLPILSLLDYDRVDSIKVSDHKPVTAVFSLQVKRIDVEAQRKMYGEVVRRLDKFENDSMPKIELPSREVVFTDLRFDMSSTETVAMSNVGQSKATFRFVPKLEESEFCKPWLSLCPSFGMILPGETIEFQITAHIDRNTIHAVNCGRETLDDILILCFENGPHFFLSVRASLVSTCFGMSLMDLVSNTAPVRGGGEATMKVQDGSSTATPASIPPQLWRLVDALYQQGAMKAENLFMESAGDDETFILREALDTGSAFPSSGPSHHAYAQTLLSFLENLATPVVLCDEKLANISEGDIDASFCTEFIAKLEPVNHNVFVYVIVFLKELLTHSELNRLTAPGLAEIFSTVFTFPSGWLPVESDPFVCGSEVKQRLRIDRASVVCAQENIRKMIFIFLSV